MRTRFYLVFISLIFLILALSIIGQAEIISPQKAELQGQIDKVSEFISAQPQTNDIIAAKKALATSQEFLDQGKIVKARNNLNKAKKLSGYAPSSGDKKTAFQKEIDALAKSLDEKEQSAAVKEAKALLQKAQTALNNGNLELAAKYLKQASKAGKAEVRKDLSKTEKADTFLYSLTAGIIFTILTVLLYVFEKKRFESFMTFLATLLIFAVMTFAFYIYLADFTTSHNSSWGTSDILFLRSLGFSTGYLGVFALSVSLLIGPLFRLFKKRFLAACMKYRRNIGVMSFLLILAHVLVEIRLHYAGNVLAPFKGFIIKIDDAVYFHLWGSSIWDHTFAIFIGFIGLFLLFILAVTSNTFAIRKLGGRIWKFIQRFAYLIFLVSIIHTLAFGFLYKNSDSIRYAVLGSVILVVLFQLLAFFVTIARKIKAQRNQAAQ